jgi:DNA-binding response OmpR family regulator
MVTDRTVWVVEDDPSAIFVYEDILKLRYQIRVFSELAPFIEAIKSKAPRPDFLISDLRLGDESFLDFLTSVDSIDYLTCPFIIISNVDDLDILRLCFDEGAIDYLTKPFTKNELLVKIERLLKSKDSHTSGPIPLGEGKIIFDPFNMSLKRFPNYTVYLTAKEMQLYSLINSATEKGDSISRNELIKELWGEVLVSSKSLDVHLYHLRKKLRVLEIQLEFGAFGYKIKLPEG